MDMFWNLIKLAASLLLFLEVKRLVKVIHVCRLNELKCTASYVQAAAMFLASALLILSLYADLAKEPDRWLSAPHDAVLERTWVPAEYPAPETPGSVAKPRGVGATSVPREGVVARVIDGDTILLESGDRVTYIGLDAPEIVHPRKPVEPLGREAYRLNRELVEGKRIRLQFEERVRDRYNRVLAYVFAGDVFINAELVRRGLARVTAWGLGGGHALQLSEAEREARRENRGLWAVQ